MTTTTTTHVAIHGIEPDTWAPGWVLAAALLLICTLIGLGVQAYRPAGLARELTEVSVPTIQNGQ